METKLKELHSLLETLGRLEVVNLAKYPNMIATYQEFRCSKLEPSLSPSLLSNIAPMIPSKSDGSISANLLPH